MVFRMTAAVAVFIAMVTASLPAVGLAQQTYVLGPGDVIEIFVFGNPDVSRVVTIRPDGMISLPLVGDVLSAGLTPDELRVRLTGLYARFLRAPQVTVIVREFRRVRVSVLGQVVRPGGYELALPATVLDALAAAGGLAVDAGLGEARVMRGQDPPLVINLERLLLNGEIALNVGLESGDTLVVPDDPAARVYVLGEVARPGIFPLRGVLTAVQALTLAGGPTRLALLGRAHVIRREGQAAQPAGTVALATVVVARQPAATIRVIPIDLHKILREGDIARDVLLQRGDVLYIPENPLALQNVALLLGVAADLIVVLR